MNRKEYLETLYKVWGVTKDQDKLNFWEIFQGPSGGTDISHAPLSSRVKLEEEFSLGGGDPDDDFWPNEREIRIQKWFWERGASEDPRAKLRYFLHHHCELSNQPGAPDEFTDLKDALEWYYDKLIFSS